MLSLGIEASLAFCTASASDGLPSTSPPPSFAATVMARASLVKSLPRRASTIAFLCLIPAHFECPAMRSSLLPRRGDPPRPLPALRRPARHRGALRPDLPRDVPARRELAAGRGRGGDADGDRRRLVALRDPPRRRRPDLPRDLRVPALPAVRRRPRGREAGAVAAALRD